jgi:hypothetical protein
MGMDDVDAAVADQGDEFCQGARQFQRLLAALFQRDMGNARREQQLAEFAVFARIGDAVAPGRLDAGEIDGSVDVSVAQATMINRRTRRTDRASP